MSNTRNTGFLTNIIQYTPSGNISFVSGSTTLMSISSSGAITTTGVISGSNAATASSVANLNQNVQITGSLGVTSTITAQTLNVQTVTSSIVYSSGSNIFGNNASNVQQFTGSVLVTGSMGVGTSSPTNGKLEIQQTATTAGLWVQSGGTTSGFTVADFRTGTNLSALQILGNGTSSFGGNVGIGTSSPISNLQINGNNNTVYDASVDTGQDDAGVTATIRNNDTSTVGSFSQINMMVSGDSGRALGRIVTIRMASATSDMAFVTENANTKAEKMRITAAGNVGMGTSSPTHNLEIANASGSVYQKMNADFGIGYFGMETADDSMRFVTAQATPIQFYTNNTERVRIGSTATQWDLMIGCTSVLHPAANRGSVSVNGTSTSIYSLGVGGVAKAYVYHGGTQMYIENSASGGNVYVIAGGAAGVVLNAGATSWTGNSDERLKNINSHIENALSKLLTLRAVNFSWKSDITNKENLGLIAQDVEKVFPQIVDSYTLPSKIDEESPDETEYLGVRYTELIPVLVKAIQELKAENDSLKEILQRNNIQ